MKRKTAKALKVLAILLILIIIYAYYLAIDNVPDNMVVYEGETLSVNRGMGFSIVSNDIIETSSDVEEKTLNEAGKQTVQVSLFDNFLVKDVNVDVIPRTTVIPVGCVAGVKLYTEGVLVIGMSEIQGLDNKIYKPYEGTGIVEGDAIVAINDNQISSTEDLISLVNSSKGNPVEIQYRHNNEIIECSIEPVKTSSTEYKLGLWVRDSAAGVGTVTFYEPSTKTFGALGHGITDVDTNKLINISSGEFITTKIMNVVKGENGNPGRLQGSIDGQTTIGTISKNSQFGVYGMVDNVSSLNIDASREMEVALREEIQEGKATILCSVDNQNVDEYEIEIEKVYNNNNYDNKSMKIKVTDERLIEKTGGIIQGMSGAPIIQNGKFIGAVTNVLVNNPQEGYGVFGDIMIKQSRNVQ